MSAPPLTLLGLVVVALGAGACTPTIAYVERPPAILVEPVGYDLPQHGARRGYTSLTDRRRIGRFLSDVSGGRVDAVHVTVAGPPGLRRSVTSAARAAGVEASKIVEVDGGPPRVTATIHRATPPVCPDLDIVGPPVNENLFEPTHGCSSLTNLAAMANDPADLVGNPAFRRGDGERAALPVARYRAGADALANRGGNGGAGAYGGANGAAPLVSTGGAIGFGGATAR
jgi:pilus biogenesis lipoprotein CpaD